MVLADLQTPGIPALIQADVSSSIDLLPSISTHYSMNIVEEGRLLTLLVAYALVDCYLGRDTTSSRLAQVPLLVHMLIKISHSLPDGLAGEVAAWRLGCSSPTDALDPRRCSSLHHTTLYQWLSLNLM